jgi:hypothetical protein
MMVDIKRALQDIKKNGHKEWVETIDHLLHGAFKFNPIGEVVNNICLQHHPFGVNV